MTISENARRHALVSYAILAVTLSAALFAAFATPVRARAAFLSGLDSQNTTYAKSLEAIARSEAVGAQLTLRQTAGEQTAQLFVADTPALAGADLQNRLNALVAAENGTLLSSAFRDSGADGALTAIGVTIRLRCSMDALLRILHGLENRSPVLMVENLTVQAPHVAGRPQRERDGDLDVELDVIGFLGMRAAL